MTNAANDAWAGTATQFLLALVKQGAPAKDVAQLVVTSCFEISKALTPIIGQRGLMALLSRSAHLAGIDQPWLVIGHTMLDLSTDLDELLITLSQQTPELAALGGGALLEHFLQLLTALVGPSLTERLLRSVWATFLSGSFPQDSPQDSPP
jgi:hypothetical protein